MYIMDIETKILLTMVSILGFLFGALLYVENIQLNCYKIFPDRPAIELKLLCS